jgi:hypothetical protein
MPEPLRLGQKFMRPTPNFQDENRIKKLLQEGKSTQEISDVVRVELSAVELYVNQLIDAAQEAKAEREAEEESDDTSE